VLRGDAIVLKHGAAPFDFKLHEGEIVGLAGLDGAGQAAFVRTLTGIERPLSGSVEASASGGHAPIRSIADADAACVAYVSGDRKREGVFPNLSVLENFGMAVYGRHRGRTGLIDRTSLGTTFEAEVARLGIRMGAPTNRITSLSGGNQQKVLIARAFAANPRVIVLNDPARGVDIGTKQELYRQLIAFAGRGGAVVYLSSEIEEFFDFADRVDVFVNAGLTETLRGGDIAEEALLYAMFGRAKPDAAFQVAREVA
jgi:ribose transport system ATP-binding protein